MAAGSEGLPYRHYRYRPLDDAAKQVRLLKRVRRDVADETTLSYTLETYDWLSAPEYAAMSYTWGSTLSTKTIQVDNTPLSVRANCYDALHRAATHSDFFWIDGVCINQADSDEKSLQVAHMVNIYSGATVVLAYVGEHELHSAMLVHTLNDLATHLGQDDWYNNRRKLRIRCRFDALMTAQSKISGDFAAAWLEFGSRQYWRRKWIIQEIWVAKRVIILCGHDQMELAEITAVIRSLHWAAMDLNDAESLRDMELSTEAWHKTNFWYLLTSMKDYQYTSDGIGFDMPALSSLWTDFWAYECSDFRDNMYALLHIIDWNLPAPVANYKLDTIGFLLQFLECAGRPGTYPTDDLFYHGFRSVIFPESLSLIYNTDAMSFLARREMMQNTPQALSQSTTHIGAFLRHTMGWPSFSPISQLAPELIRHLRSTYVFEQQTDCPELAFTYWPPLRLTESAQLDDLVIQVAEGSFVWLVGRVKPATAQVQLIGYALAPVQANEESHDPVYNLEHGQAMDIYFSTEDLLMLRILESTLNPGDGYVWKSGTRSEFAAKALRMSPTAFPDSSYGVIVNDEIDELPSSSSDE